MNVIETVVCSAKDDSTAKLRRLVLARQEFKRRQNGCIAAWMGTAIENDSMILVQSVYTTAQDWKAISEKVRQELDEVDGGIERFCSALRLSVCSTLAIFLRNLDKSSKWPNFRAS